MVYLNRQFTEWTLSHEIILFLSVQTNLQDLIPTLALVVCVAYNYAAKVGIKSCRFV